MPSIARVLAALLPVTLAGAGCGHSDPFVAVGLDDRPTGFAILPEQLTFNERADLHPQWSPSGDLLLYAFERWLPLAEYPDRCLGALPRDGGARVLEWCWQSLDEGLHRDGIEAGTLLSDGRLVFTHHAGAGVKQPIPVTASLYLADTAAITGAQRQFELLRRPDGASERYDFLHGLVPTADERAVTALAVSAIIDAPCPVCDFDTTYVGVDLVRIPLDASGAVEVIAPLPAARFLGWDRALGTFFFARHGRVESIAATGGTPTLVWQAPRSPDRERVTITGLGVGARRMAVSWSWEERGAHHSVVGLLGEDGEVAVLDHQVDGARWGELALSPDGTRLVAERQDPGTPPNLYLFRLP